MGWPSTLSREARSDGTIIAAAAIEIVGGAAAMVFAIAGLLHYVPASKAHLCAIVLGAALAMNAGLLAAERRRVTRRNLLTALDTVEFSGGVSVEAAAGIAAMVVGLLASHGVDRATMTSMGALVLGIATIVGGGVTTQINLAVADSAAGESSHDIGYAAVAFAATVQVVAGIGAIVLAGLALAGFSAATLAFAAYFAVGSASVVVGIALAGRMAGGGGSAGA